jgi:hypothetical protein
MSKAELLESIAKMEEMWALMSPKGKQAASLLIQDKSKLVVLFLFNDLQNLQIVSHESINHFLKGKEMNDSVKG